MGSSPSKAPRVKNDDASKYKAPKRTASEAGKGGRRNSMATKGSEKRTKTTVVKKWSTKVESKPPSNKVIRRNEPEPQFTSVEEEVNKHELHKPPGYEESSLKREIERKKRRLVFMSKKDVSSRKASTFLVGVFITKRARLLQLFFSVSRIRSDEIFVLFVQLNDYLGNASKLLQRLPLSIFTF